MKVICDRGALLESLNLAGSVAQTRTPKPVLTCVKISASDKGLRLSATDMESSILLANQRVEVSEAGEALVPADKLSQIVRESVDATLTLESDEESLHIRGQDSHFKVLGMPVSDFPPIPDFPADEAAEFEIASHDLNQVIQQTIYATARENSRYAINGVLMEREGNKLSVVATDGHRLAVAKADCKAGKAGDGRKNIIVPTKALTLLLKLLGNSEQTVRVKTAENQILLATENAVLASNLVEGNFPPYKDVVPRDGDKKATLDTDSLASAFRRAALLTNEESKGVRMAFTKEKLVITSRAPEMGEAEIQVDLPAYEGDPVEIGFNPTYMLDALKVVGTEQVNMDLRASNKPGVIRSGTDFLYVVMPVNLQ